MLLPHIQRYFGPEGVTIDHRGKYSRALEVKANGEHKWVQKKISRVFRTTPKNYADIIARSSMVNANNEGRYQTLAASNLTKGYTWSCVCDSASCEICLGLHGQEIKRGDFPPAHPRCRCRAAPIWKDSSGLKNRDPEYYFKQRDTAMYRKYKLKEFNAKLPRGVPKLKFDSLLPKDYVGSLPDSKEMYAIRKAMLE
jgi:SPP1 gp7 family putative phage head morphogenesis protein